MKKLSTEKAEQLSGGLLCELINFPFTNVYLTVIINGTTYVDWPNGTHVDCSSPI